MRPGITAAAPATIKGDPVTFDLAGFRLGMSEAEIEAVIRQRGMKVRNRERTTWCGKPGNCFAAFNPFRLMARAGDKGGTVELSSPDGMASQVSDAIQAEVTRRGRTSAPVL